MRKYLSKHVWISTLFIVAVMAFFILPACAAPEIKILEPKEGSEIPAGNVTVTVEVSDFNIVDKQGQAKVEGEGHIHYFMDEAIPTAPGEPAVTTGTYIHTVNTSYIWQNVTPGMHNFSVELVNNDHTPLDPPVLSLNNVRVVESNISTASTTSAGQAMENASMTNASMANVSMTNATMANATMENVTPSQAVTVDLVAKNNAFDKDTITVPAGAKVTVNFDNQDRIPHGFSVYDSPEAKTAIYKGKVTSASSKAVYTFDAPTAPGTYFFRDDLYSRIMTGKFIVQ